MIDNFHQWLEGQEDFNLSGVPHYAPSTTSPIRGPNFDAATQSSGIEDARYQRERNQRMYSVGQKFRFTPSAGNYYRKWGSRVGTISSVGSTNIGYAVEGGSIKSTIGASTFRYLLQNGGIELES